MAERDWGPTPSKGIFLNSTSCCIRPAKSVLKAIVESAKACYNYPDPFKKKLLNSLSDYTGFDEENLFIGNGSDKVLRVIAECFIEKGDRVVVFNPSFPVFDSAVEMMGGKLEKLDLVEEKSFALPFERALAMVEKGGIKVVYIATPNNPTGNMLLNESQLRKLLASGVLVILDECYCEFSGATFAELVQEFDSLIVVRSMSKAFGMTGLRIGYSIASAEITRAFKRIENAIEIFNCSSVSLDAAVAALEEEDYYAHERKRVMKTGGRLAKDFEKMGISCAFGNVPFLFCNVSRVGGATAFARELEKQGVFVKAYSNFGDKFLRVSVPREKDFEKVVEAFENASRMVG